MDRRPRTSLMIVSGPRSSRLPPRAFISIVRGWSQRTTPVVRMLAPSSDTAKPAVRAKLPPLVTGTTTGRRVTRLKAADVTLLFGNRLCSFGSQLIIIHGYCISLYPGSPSKRPFLRPRNLDTTSFCSVQGSYLFLLTEIQNRKSAQNLLLSRGEVGQVRRARQAVTFRYP